MNVVITPMNPNDAQMNPNDTVIHTDAIVKYPNDRRNDPNELQCMKNNPIDPQNYPNEKNRRNVSYIDSNC